MSQSNHPSRQSVPAWVLVTVGILGLIVVGFFGWRAVAGYAPEAGPPMQVRPHMYDLQAEVAKHRGAQQTEAAQHGPQ